MVPKAEKKKKKKAIGQQKATKTWQTGSKRMIEIGWEWQFEEYGVWGACLCI